MSPTINSSQKSTKPCYSFKMNTQRRIDLIRHAESENNATRLLVGGKAIETILSEKGIAQAKQLGIDYGQIPAGIRLYSSPAIRAVHTAQIAFLEKEGIHLSDSLLETNRGIHENQLVSQVYTEEFLSDQARQGFDHKSPGGESLNEAADRLQEFLNQFEPGSQVVAVSHSRIIKALLARLEGFTYEQTRDRSIIDIGNTTVTRFENNGRGWMVPFFGRAAVEVANEDFKQGYRSA